MAAPIAMPCNARWRTCQRIGVPFAPAPGCSAPANRVACAIAPTPFAPLPAPHAPVHTVCTSCWNRGNAFLTPLEHTRLDEPIIRRGVLPGEPKYVTSLTGVRALLCRFCEADEQELYKRNIATGAVPAGFNRNGWVNTCVCHSQAILLLNVPGVGPPPAARYCTDCRDRAKDEIVHHAVDNRNELNQLARNQAGARHTAHLALNLTRGMAGKPIACRCGRDTIVATHHPKVTQCLCCGGVQVDIDQVKMLRNTQQRLATAAAAGNLPALNNVAANFNLDDRPPVSRPFPVFGIPTVVINNNRK